MCPEPAPDMPRLDARSLELRRQAIRVLKAGRRGHLGAAFSLIEIVRVLYDDVLRHDPEDPDWSDRDRCILSKGHGCIAQYVLLAEKGFFPESELWGFCSTDGLLGGHPEHHIPGVEASTGSLGHGLSLGIGMALAARYDRRDSRTFVILGDGECNEGSIWEAAMCASKHGLDSLTVLIDYNHYQSSGSTYDIQDLEPFVAKWQSFGWGALDINGHDVGELRRVLGALPNVASRPTAIICHTVKGKGISFAENNLEWHHKSKITDEQIGSLLAELETP